MPNLLCNRAAIKAAMDWKGPDRNYQIDRTIEAHSRRIEIAARRFFIPRTETRLYRWPGAGLGTRQVLWLDQDLISVTTLLSEAQNASPTTISASDYFLEPVNSAPPFDRIEIDLSSSAAFTSGETPQRSISVAGLWGYNNNTRGVGTVVSGLASSASATTMACSDSGLLTGVSVGDTLLIESEQIYVSQRTHAALATPSPIFTNGALTANQAEVSVTIDSGHGIADGEIILLESERIYVESSIATILTVKRAYDGSVLASHPDDTVVETFRSLTIERGVNGTTAATHADTTAISKQEPPFDIEQLCIAETIASLSQEGAAWGRSIGSGDGASELSGRELANMRQWTMDLYLRGRNRTAI